MDKSINTSAFDEVMTTRKRSDIRVFFRDKFPPSLKIITKISGVVTEYSDPTLAAAYASVSGGRLIIKAPPGLGDITMVHTRRHSVFHPNNGKRFSTSLFYDNFETGDYEVGFGNHSETDLVIQDAILLKISLGVFSGLIVKDGVEKTWPNGSKVITPNDLNGLELVPSKGHLFDIQAQLRNVGNIYYFLSATTAERPKEVLQFNGLNNQDDVTISNPAMHGVFLCRNNGVRSQLRVGCIDMSNETDDEDIQEPAIFSNNFDVNCQTTGNVLYVIKVPFIINSTLNTQDSQYYSASVFSDKRARVKIFRIDIQSLLTKTVGGLPVPIADADFTDYPNSSLQYIDNSQSSGVPLLITGFTTTGLKPIDQKAFAAAGEVEMAPPDIRRLPITAVHGEMFVVVGYGKTAAASMSLDSLYLGTGL